MPSLIREFDVDQVFRLVQEAALSKRRCPQRDHLTTAQTKALRECAYREWIKIQVYAQNWRVVEIRKGEHAGARTLECPIGNGVPKMTVFGRPQGHRGAPSPPQPLKIAP